MLATDAQIAANRANALKSSGPSSPQGKEVSRGNALKHGLTAVKLIPEREAAEVERRTVAFGGELAPSGEVGISLVRLAARMSVRMERCAEHETAAATGRVRKALAEFVPPEGVVDPAEVARLRAEAERLALFDASKEATLARKYEAAAERSFLRALTELRRHEARVKSAREAELEGELGSFSPGDMTDEEFDAMYAREMATPMPPGYVPKAEPVNFESPRGRVDVPMTIGKRR